MNSPLEAPDDEFDEFDEKQPKQGGLGKSRVRQALSRWWIMVLVGILGYFGALYYLMIQPMSSQAVAVLEVDLKTKQLIGEELEQNRLQTGMILATVASKLSGPELISEVANHPDVQALERVIPPPFSFKPLSMRDEKEIRFKAASEVSPSDITSIIAQGVRVEPRTGTTLLQVLVDHPDATSARVIADTFLTVFIQREEGEKEGGVSEAFSILRNEADEALGDLESAETSIQVYVSALQLNDKIREQRDQLVALRQRYLPKHPEMIQQEAIYLDLYNRFRREIERAVNTESERQYWSEYTDTLAALEQQGAGDGEEAAKARDEWLALAQNTLSSRANFLNARISYQRTLYENLTRRMTEINVADENNDAGFLVSERAYVSSKPSKKRLNTLGAGTLAGIVVGFGIAYLFSLFDFRIYDVRSAEEITGLSCLAAIPLDSAFDRVVHGSVDWEPILVKEPSTANSESVRNLRASLILLGKKERHKTILMTSAVPSEGKTALSAELAAAFALNQEKTLLIDLDLRKPKIAEAFPMLKEKKGIVEVLAGQSSLESVIFETGISDLHVIGSGRRAPNPSELLHEDEIASILTTLQANYDRIIIDAAPILPVSDSRILAQLVQSVVLVVRARRTPVGAVLRTRDLLHGAGASIAGVIVNGMKRTSKSSYYYGYMGYGEYGAENGYGYYNEGGNQKKGFEK